MRKQEDLGGVGEDLCTQTRAANETDFILRCKIKYFKSVSSVQFYIAVYCCFSRARTKKI